MGSSLVRKAPLRLVRRRAAAGGHPPGPAAGSRCISVLALLLLTACARTADREYPLTGQILAVDPARQEVTIKHEDIPRFMPGMTMTFRVREASLLEGRVPGDLVRATLVVAEPDVHLRTLERVGHAPVPESATIPGAGILREGEAVADASLVDESGTPRRLADWKGRAVAVTFIYTRCPLPNFCPVMDRHFKAVQDAVRADAALAGRVQLLSVSFDPDHDTPAVLASHAGRLQADPDIWRFLTGPREEVEQLAKQFGVSVIREGADPSGIVHNLRTAVIDPGGRLSTVLNGSEWTPAELVAALKAAGER